MTGCLSAGPVLVGVLVVVDFMLSLCSLMSVLRDHFKNLKALVNVLGGIL